MVLLCLMPRSALFLGALALLAAEPAFAKKSPKEKETPPATEPAPPPEPALPEEPPPPGWDKLSPEAQQKLKNADPAAIQAVAEKLGKGETLNPEEEALADALRTLALAEFDQRLHYQTGDISLGSGLATLHLGQKYRFLGPDDAHTIITEAWGNPPGERPLGMITSADLSPADPKGWGVILTYTEDGHVSDDDAEDIDYAELLTSMQAATEEENEARKTQGFPPLHLVGWAEPPHYDKERHSLYWAKELASDGPGEHSLNYAIRVLGRKGVLELNAVAGMTQLAEIRPEMEKIYPLVEFDQGNRYSDFNPDIDTVAAYGIGGLIAGKVAMKAGLFALILKGLLAAKKALVLLVIGIGVGIKAIFSRRKKE